MSTRNALNRALSLCLVFLALSLTAWAQNPTQTDNSSQVNIIVFRNTVVKNALTALGKQLGMNVVFDESVKDSQKVTIELHDLTVESAIEIILIQQKLSARLMEDKTITVFQDTSENRQKFAGFKRWPEKRDEGQQ